MLFYIIEKEQTKKRKILSKRSGYNGRLMINNKKEK